MERVRAMAASTALRPVMTVMGSRLPVSSRRRLNCSRSSINRRRTSPACSRRRAAFEIVPGSWCVCIKRFPVARLVRVWSMCTNAGAVLGRWYLPHPGAGPQPANWTMIDGRTHKSLSFQDFHAGAGSISTATSPRTASASAAASLGRCEGPRAFRRPSIYRPSGVGTIQTLILG